MIQELADKVWSNPALHEAAARIEFTWLGQELRSESIRPVEAMDGGRAVQAAAILACSSKGEHRRLAFRLATCAYELFGTEEIPLNQALRVVLARLGNFPSMQTTEAVATAMGDLPLGLVLEEISSSDARRVTVNGSDIYFTDFQHQLWTALSRGERAALSAPTSAGKSFVLEHFVSSLFAAKKRFSALYIVPTRALIAQVAADLYDELREGTGESPAIITVPVDPDVAAPERAIYVMTQERVQLALAGHVHFSPSLIVVDEAQAIADGSRGVLLQWVIDDLLARNPKAQIMFASPTVRNLGVFGRLFGLSDVKEITSAEPTVAQNFLIVGIESGKTGRVTVQTAGDGSRAPETVAVLDVGHTTASRIDQLVHIPARIGAGESNIIYANGAAEAEKIAMQLADLFHDREVTDRREALAQLIAEAVHNSYVLAYCVRRGIGFHYSNIPTLIRRAVEQAVSKGDLDFLVCTSTLLQGINLPAKNIFMCKPEKGRSKALQSVDFWNLSGRAGRLRREFLGNIFLIDYGAWKEKPLDSPKDAVVIPAIEASLRDRSAHLIEVIGGATGSEDNPDLETSFGRLYSDLKTGGLSSTFDRIGLNADDPVRTSVATALAGAEAQLTLPPDVVRRSPNISAHKQQRLFDAIKGRVAQGRATARAMIPRHPRESDAFESYADVLKLCYDIVLGRDVSKNLHRFHALMAVRWMQGTPLPRMIDDQLARGKTTDRRKIIRGMLGVIESDIRFQAVRLFGCYNTLLQHALQVAGMQDLVATIPAIPLYLEVGASDKTMISFISLGLSRVTAMKLNDLSARKDLDPTGAREWLLTRPLADLGLSPLLLQEVEAILAG